VAQWVHCSGTHCGSSKSIRTGAGPFHYDRHARWSGTSHGCPRTRPRRTRTLRLSLGTSSGSRTRGASTDGCTSVLPESLVRFSPFCSGSWSLSDSQARTVAQSGLRSNYDRTFPYCGFSKCGC
jgi:hypothetical protein